MSRSDVTISRAVHEHVRDAAPLGVEALAPAGHVVADLVRPGADALGVEDDDVRVPTLPYPPALAQAVEAGGDLGELADGRLERQEAALADRLAEQRRSCSSRGT